MPRTALALALLLAAAGARAEDPPPRPGEVRLYLRDGRNLVGVVVERGDEGYVLETPAGGRVRVQAAEIREVVRLGAEVERPAAPDLDPARFRYLTSPSAMRLPQNGWFVSAAQPAQLFASYGLLDFLTLSAGTSVPFAYTQDDGGNLVVRVQGGWSLLPWLHAQAGVEGQVWSIRKLVFAYGEATVGTPRLHATVHAGPSPFAAWRQGYGDLSVAVSGLARVYRGVALISENWLRRDGAFAVTSGAAVRLYGLRFAADLGAVRLARGGFMPWLGLSYSPGSSRDLDL